MNSSSSARISPDEAIKSDTGYYTEELHVKTDRDLYIAGEEVFLKICKFNRYSHTPGNVSKVVYVDMHDFHNNPVIQLKIGIDKRHVPAPLYLDTGNLEAINKAIICMQVKNIYYPFLQARVSKSAISGKTHFFGDPDLSVELSEYIELTSLKEVIREIVPGVTIYTKNDKTNFKLINKYPGQPFEKDPLVILDGVPVHDIDMILSIKSSEIEKIEILNTRYFISDIIIDGIINIVSGKGDLSVLESDRSVFRQEFHALQTVYGPYSPDYSTDSLKSSRIPDFRNTLYWNPDVRTDKNGYASVEFYSSDETGEYNVITEGFTYDGKVCRSVTSLTVRNK